MVRRVRFKCECIGRVRSTRVSPNPSGSVSPSLTDSASHSRTQLAGTMKIGKRVARHTPDNENAAPGVKSATSISSHQYIQPPVYPATSNLATSIPTSGQYCKPANTQNQYTQIPSDQYINLHQYTRPPITSPGFIKYHAPTRISLF